MARNSVGLLFILSPVLGLLESFKNLKGKSEQIVLFLFCLCFGFCFCVGTERIEGSTDGISMRMEFEQNKDISAAQLGSYYSDYFAFDTGDEDVYIVTMSYLVGRITDNYHFFFLALAFVFAFFQIKCLRYFINEENFTNSFICIILTCLFLWNNIYNINGARFWTAAWIGLYCVFKVFYDNKPQYFLLSCCTFLIHASFAIFPLIVLLAYLLKSYRKPWMILFCISWVFSIFAEDFQVPLFDDISLPYSIYRKVQFYTDREYIESLSTGTGFYWVDILFKTIVRHFIELLIVLIALNEDKVSSEKSKAVIRFMIILATIANFGMVVPTFGRRFFILNYSLVAYSFLVTFGDYKYRKLICLLPFIWFMNLYYLFRDVTDVLDLGFVLSPIYSFIRYLFV